MSTLTISILITLVIILFVVIIFAAAITKGYSYKHTIDQLDDNPYLKNEDKDDEREEGKERS
ncbi:YtzI protein [Fictibacillus nanhaiensis]|jgi:uncharacterized protein YxeA|uniref:YtzI protein n=1 Tax=Fictibacillus nanhaiensis TaxID=742169 RepID=UPI003C15561F